MSNNYAIYRLIFPLFFLLPAFVGISQEGFFIVENILLEGNKKTHAQVIYNELEVMPGDTVYFEDFTELVVESRKRVLGTALFTGCEVNIKNWRTDVHLADLEIKVQENWYIYPSLIFELADRNFNVWWTEQNRDFDRVNYGVGLEHINLFGRKDKLKFKVQGGYTRKYEINYNYPYINKTWGASGEIFFSDQREIAFSTDGNKLLFRQNDDERKLLRRFRIGAGVNHRPDVYNFHNFTITYHQNGIDDFVSDLNPDYFLNGATELKYFRLSYNYTWDGRIFNLYPEGGSLYSINLTKEGIGVFDGINNLSLSLGYEKHIKISDRWIYGTRLKVKTNILRNPIPYANNQGLGYGNDLVRGYELYVVDGTDWAIAKSSMRFLLYENDYKHGKYMVIDQFEKMNIRLFLRANLDFGFVNEPTYQLNNELINRTLIGYGPAFDMLLYHTYKFSIEYSFNHLNERGLFLSSDFNF